MMIPASQMKAAELAYIEETVYYCDGFALPLRWTLLKASLGLEFDLNPKKSGWLPHLEQEFERPRSPLSAHECPPLSCGRLASFLLHALLARS